MLFAICQCFADCVCNVGLQFSSWKGHLIVISKPLLMWLFCGHILVAILWSHFGGYFVATIWSSHIVAQGSSAGSSCHTGSHGRLVRHPEISSLVYWFWKMHLVEACALAWLDDVSGHSPKNIKNAPVRRKRGRTGRRCSNMQSVDSEST